MKRDELRKALHEAWADVLGAMPTGGTQRERQAYGNGARDVLDSLGDVLGLPLAEDPWDRWVAPDDVAVIVKADRELVRTQHATGDDVSRGPA